MLSRDRKRHQNREDERRPEGEPNTDLDPFQIIARELRNATLWARRNAYVAIAGVLVAVIAVVTATYLAVRPASGGSGNDRPSPSASKTSPSASGPSSSVGPGISYNAICPAPQGPNHQSSLQIRVAEWCLLPAVRNQAQMKVKVWLDNTATTNLDTSLGRFRLLVNTLDPAQWTPPGGRTTSSLRPMQVQYGDNGKKYTVWAIPPNPNGAAEPIPDQPGDDTFATHWSLQTLGPGQKFRPPATTNPRQTTSRKGDLVFYVPLAHANITPRVVGLAYVDSDNQVVVISPSGSWGPREPAENF